jgi:hypothetical protein
MDPEPSQSLTTPTSLRPCHIDSHSHFSSPFFVLETQNLEPNRTKKTSTFETLCDSYGIKRKPTTIKNLQANAICERLHQVLGTMMHTSELDMADSVEPADIDTFIDNAAWAICSTYHTVLKESPAAAIFGRDMLFDILFVAHWKQIGDYRQHQTDCSNKHENNKCVDYDYKVGDKILIRKDGILRKAESIRKKEPWTITIVHTNETIRIQCKTKSERINIRRVTPFSEELLI